MPVKKPVDKKKVSTNTVDHLSAAEKKTNSFSSSSLLSSYLSDINNEEGLSKEEENRLFERYKRGDMRARDKLIRGNLRFVFLMVRRLGGLPIEDLINEGNNGLLEAMKRYDGSKECRFISYAVWWVRQAALKAISEQKCSFHIPLNMQCRMAKINSVRNRLNQKLGRNPTVEEIAEELKISTAKVSEAMAFSKKTFHMDDKRTDDKNATTMLDTMVDKNDTSVDNSILCSHFRREFKTFFKKLSKTELAVVTSLYSKNETLDDIARKLNLPLTRISQLHKQALTKIKNSPEANRLRRYLNENMQQDF